MLSTSATKRLGVSSLLHFVISTKGFMDKENTLEKVNHKEVLQLPVQICSSNDLILVYI